MSAGKLLSFVMLLLSLLSSLGWGQDAQVGEEIVVVGRQPGPPLWKVSNGDNVLWIFPYLEWIPGDMLWDSRRVARVIAQSQEALSLPEIDYTYSPLLTMNPLNIVRGTRLFNRFERYPDGGTLEQNLPPELYARYATLQARYFPHERGYAVMRPREVGGRMMHIVREREGLVSGRGILTTIRRNVRRNSGIRLMDTSVEVHFGPSYRDYANTVEQLMESFPAELEHACFEQQVRLMEEIDETKHLANSWAQGDIYEFRRNEFYNVSLSFGDSVSCDELYTGNASSVQDNVTRTSERLNQAWTDAAQRALATNASTFAILPINELLAADGLLSRLRANGYEVREP